MGAKSMRISFVITFGGIEKQKFHQHKSSISINNVKLVVSYKVNFGKKGFKYFIGYKDVKKVRLLCVILPKMSAYRREFDVTTYMSFLIKNH